MTGFGVIQEHWYDSLAAKAPQRRRFWNRIPDQEKEQILTIALEGAKDTPRRLACFITDKEGYFMSESSVCRILKACDMVPSPSYIVMAASDSFRYPTTRVHELCQSDFTYFRVVGGGRYYQGSILYDYSRYVIALKLYTTMATRDVKDLLNIAVEKTGIQQISIRHPKTALGQWTSLRLRRAQTVSSDKRNDTDTRCTVASENAREDRTVSSLDEERNQLADM
jgi:hypothetical protein